MTTRFDVLWGSGHQRQIHVSPPESPASRSDLTDCRCLRPSFRDKWLRLRLEMINKAGSKFWAKAPSRKGVKGRGETFEPTGIE